MTGKEGTGPGQHGEGKTSATGISRRAMLAAGMGAAAATALSTGSASAATTASAAASATGDQLTVDIGSGSPLQHFWEGCIGGDHAKQALRRDFQDQLARAHRELGVQRIRMHGIIDPQMSVYANRSASFTQGAYSLFNVHQIYDYIVGIGMHPFVEVSFMPPALSSVPTSNTIFYYDGNPYPPASYTAWGDLVTAFAADLVDRYGIQEVRQWPFEVWNEPNLRFWQGTPQQYYQLYQVTAEAIKGVDASLPVGGPATDGNGLSFLEGFLSFVESNSLPLDFVSSHGYENNTLSGVNGVADIFVPTRAVIPTGTPYYISETGCNFSNVTSELDTSYAAAFLVKAIDRCDGITDILSLWCFSDIFEEGSQASNIFYGGFGALTQYGVPKPMYRVFQLLHQAGTRRLAVSGTSPGDTVGALAIGGDSNDLDVFLYNHAYPGGPAPADRTVSLTLNGNSAPLSATLTRIDPDNANPAATWRDQGQPLYPKPAQLDALNAASEVHPVRLAPLDPDGRTYQLQLPAEGVAVLSFRPAKQGS